MMLTLVANHLRASTTPPETPILFNYESKVCKVTINRPKILNAQSLEVLSLLKKEASKWDLDNNTRVAIVTGAGKAFSVGGDIKSMYEARNDVNGREMIDAMFRTQYSMDYYLANMKTIQVVFWDGMVMGGGVGISVYAPIRIATENAVFAMPEGKIGLFTDCGAGYFFSRVRNNYGYLMGIAGHRLRGQEIVKAGLADYYVKSEKLASLEREIIEKTDSKTTLEDVRKIVEKYQEPILDKKLPYEDFVKDIFGRKTVDEIYEALQNATENKEFAQKILAAMDGQCPFSMKVIHELIKRGKDLDIKENLKNDMRLLQRFLDGTDFFEGVRCTLVDKNDKPKWVYPTLKDVPQKEVERYFEKLPPHLELQLP